MNPPTNRRSSDPVIMEINGRLDKLEEIDSKLGEILQFVETMGRVQEYLEKFGNFLARWAIIFGKIGAAVGFSWAMLKYGLGESVVYMRGWFVK